MKYILFLIFTFNISFCQEKLTINKDSPKINITDWIYNIPSQKDINGKYIVLEFWATWCSPCLKSIPHLNNLQTKFNQDNLIFISITDEKVSKVKKILELVKFNSIVVTDTTKVTQKNFGNNTNGISELPLTVLIDDRNVVKWIGKPKNLTEEIMNSFLEKREIFSTVNNSKKLNFTRQTNFEKFLEIAKDDQIEYYFEIKKTERSNLNSFKLNKVNPNLFYLEAINIKELLLTTLNYNINLFTVDSILGTDSYDVTFKKSINTLQNFDLLEINILNFFSLKKSIEFKRIQSYGIYTNHNILEKSFEIEHSVVKFENNVLLFHYNIQMLCDYLNKNSDLLFHCNNSEKNKFFNFKINIKDQNSILESLESLGLKTVKEFEEFEFLHFKNI
ncbi:TlpA family protein disulfide reductase [Flavobacterium tegetincola]|uniref:TlpA family protein disulfide reductase n=1 Tax=Flavobacterium tegetincola TaxID=150172 RepID=UPI0003F86918|nr:TlpA disulfide reductase family protein [Flavobacterium tegetincola]